MKYRKLRIAWSVGCGITCVLLIVLWVRSYRVADIFGCNKPRSFGLMAFSATGRMEFGLGETRASFKSVWASLPHELIHDLKGYAAGSGFEIRSQHPPNTIGVKLPHWFLVLIVVGLGVMSWFGWSNRFSLRTLLIATTLVAVVLGLIVWTLGR
jgi:hypothetical protein